MADARSGCMVERSWLVDAVADAIDDAATAATLVARTAAELGLVGDAWEVADTLTLLDTIKRRETGLAALAASTLKVRIITLAAARPRLSLDA